MKPAPFTYHRPDTLDEAVALLAELAPQEGRILAGGQSLVPMMAFRLSRPAHLIDINRIAALQQLCRDGDLLVIGAGVRHAAFHRPVCDGPLGRLLGIAAQHIAHYPIRQRGTFCGSLAHADPSSEWCLVAVTLGATLMAESRRGRRAIAAADFFAGIMTTALDEDEMLVAVQLPILPAATRFGFQEYSRRAGDYGMAIALALYREEEGVIRDARLGIGGAEAQPHRIPEAEAVLEGKAPDEALFARAADIAAAAIDPLQDAQVPAAYRRALVRAMARRALLAAAAP